MLRVSVAPQSGMSNGLPIECGEVILPAHVISVATVRFTGPAIDRMQAQATRLARGLAPGVAAGQDGALWAGLTSLAVGVYVLAIRTRLTPDR